MKPIEHRELPWSHKINFWKSGKSAPRVWIDKACAEIEKHGGRILMKAEGHEDSTGRDAFCVVFEIGGEHFKIVWPILPNEYKGDELAARRQAATILYHDVKQACLKSRIFGVRLAFFSHYMLPDGRTISEITDPEAVKLVVGAGRKEIGS